MFKDFAFDGHDQKTDSHDDGFWVTEHLVGPVFINTDPGMMERKLI